MSEPRVKVRVLRLPHAEGLPLPRYETAGAAGLDVPAALHEPRSIAPGEVARVPTGLQVEIPAGYELQLRPRSGLAARHALTLANSPATIDSDYRGEVIVLLHNLGREPVIIERGTRIAQMVLQRVPRLEWEESGSLAESARGEGGLGSTGTR